MALLPVSEFQIFNENDESWRSDINHLYQRLLKYFEIFETEANAVIEILIESQKLIKNHHTNANKFRTGTTGCGVISTVLTTTGIALGPATMGASLALTIAGLVIAFGSAITTAGIEIKDYGKTKKFCSEIQKIYMKLEKPRESLNNISQEINILVSEMGENIYTQFDRKKGKSKITKAIVVDGGRVIQNSTNVAVAALEIGTTPVKITKSVAENVVGGNKLISGSIQITEAASSVGGKALQSTSSVLIGLTAGFGAVFTTLDIGLLIYSWLKKHPAEKVIESLIEHIRDEINGWKSYLKEIRELCLIRNSHILWERLQHFIHYCIQRERLLMDKLEELQTLANEFEQWKKLSEEKERQMKQAVEEMERRRKQEAEQMEKRMKQEVEEIEKRLKQEADHKYSKCKEENDNLQRQIEELKNLFKDFANKSE